jgi:hypothetical protein
MEESGMLRVERSDEADEVDHGGEGERRHLGLRRVEPLVEQQDDDHQRRRELKAVALK